MNYTEIADELGVLLCDGGDACRFTGLDEPIHKQRRHDRGYPDAAIRTIHWRPRRVVPSGLRHFLILVTEVHQPWLTIETPWLRIWNTNLYVQKLTDKLKIRLPRKLADGDRARLRFLLSEVPYRERQSLAGSFKSATRWAGRS